jgi:imidazole glycerol-phosphate synthase subunit HisF
MIFHRVIPKLDIKGPNLVKGVHLEGLRVLGKPEVFANKYFANGADELIFQDTVASLYQRSQLLEIVSRTAEAIFIPLTVGGGVRSLQDIEDVLRAGADKVAINTAAVRSPEFIDSAVRVFGSSTIIVSIDVISHSSRGYIVYTENGREDAKICALDWAREVEERGAGEILLTSIDREGTGEGYDLELIKQISKNTSIPVIGHGGAGSANDMVKALTESKAHAVSASSIFHYHLLKGLKNNAGYEEEGNCDFLKKEVGFKKFGTHRHSIESIKKDLLESGVPVRID